VAYGPGQAYPPQPQPPPVPAGQEAGAWGWYSGPVNAGPTHPGMNPTWLAANADRERTVGVLRAGFTEGRLTQDELDDRVARAYAARTYADLWALTADLPSGALPYPQPVLPYSHAVVPHESHSPGTWRSATTLIITALVIFTIAALLTAIATAHAQPAPFPGFQQAPPVQQVQLEPAYVYTQPMFRHLNMSPAIARPQAPTVGAKG
jgi:Domain of unknown function (DUF1707)